MIVDKQTEFSNAQPITVSAQSTNNYDNGPVSSRGNAHGNTMGPEFVFVVEQTFVGGTSLQIQIRDSAASDRSGSVVLASGPVIPVADLVVGKRIAWRPLWPRGTRRYTDLFYNVVGTFTAGAITATTSMAADDAL